MKILILLFFTFLIKLTNSKLYFYPNYFKNFQSILDQKVCPPGSIGSFQNDVCWYFIDVPLNFIEAEKYCQGLNGHLASIHNAFDNLYMTDKAKGIFTQSDAFITGGNNLENKQQWTWINGDTFDFNDWDTNEPANTDVHHCLHIETNRGLWFASDCLLQLPFVCQVYPSNPITSQPATTRYYTVSAPSRLTTSWWNRTTTWPSFNLTSTTRMSTVSTTPRKTTYKMSTTPRQTTYKMSTTSGFSKVTMTPTTRRNTNSTNVTRTTLTTKLITATTTRPNSTRMSTTPINVSKTTTIHPIISTTTKRPTVVNSSTMKMTTIKVPTTVNWTNNWNHPTFRPRRIKRFVF